MQLKYNFDPRLKSQTPKDILHNPPVHLWIRDFNEDALKHVHQGINDALAAGQEVLPVIIDSYGGYVHSLLGMIDLLNSSGLTIATIVQGKAMSCGAHLSAMGTIGYRFVAPTSTILHHEMSAGMWGKESEIKAKAEAIENLATLLSEQLSTHCGHKKDWLHKKFHEHNHADWTMSPEEALSHNLADYIGTPTFNVKVNVEMELQFPPPPKKSRK